MSLFLSFPTEILIDILVNLEVKDAIAVKSVNHRLRQIYQDSSKLQYALQCQLAGVDDNPSCTLPTSIRLKRLIEREQRWLCFEPLYTSSISPPRPTSCQYAVGDEFILLGMSSAIDSAPNGVQSYRIPSEKNLDPECKDLWTFFQVDGLIDFAPCIEEHDLLVCVSSSSGYSNLKYSSPNLEIHIQFFQHSTGNPHPLAIKDGIRIEIERPEEPILDVNLEISGENLIMILQASTCWFRLYVYEWKTGFPKSVPTPVYNLGLILLRCDLFLHPNDEDGCLDIYHILPSPGESIKRICCLGLPPLRPGISMNAVQFYSSPQPTNCDSLTKYISPTRPFRERPQDGLIIISWDIMEIEMDGFVRPLTMHSRRKSIISCLPTEPTWSTSTCQKICWQDWIPGVCSWSTIFSEYITACHGQRFIDLRDEFTASILSFNPHYLQKYKALKNIPTTVPTHMQITKWEGPPDIFVDEIPSEFQSAEVLSSFSESSAGMIINGVCLLSRRSSTDKVTFDIYYFG